MGEASKIKTYTQLLDIYSILVLRFTVVAAFTVVHKNGRFAATFFLISYAVFVVAADF